MSESTKGKIITPKFVPDPALSKSNRVYANYVLVRHTGIDFTISFIDVPPPTEEQIKLAKKGATIPVPVQCDVVVPNDLIPRLIKALQDQNDKFKKGQSANKGKIRVGENKPNRKD